MPECMTALSTIIQITHKKILGMLLIVNSLNCNAKRHLTTVCAHHHLAALN